MVEADVTAVQGLTSPLQLVTSTEPGKAIRHTISTIVDGIPALLKVLDIVAKSHPFIAIAVGAFRVAVELDLKRRDNDKKISLLFVEMRDMMAVLVQLKDVNRDKRAGDDNTTISGRMQHLVEKTEQDIRKCANACNAYAKKNILSKVVHSSAWDGEFKGYIQGFTTRRGEFGFALSIYIGRAVNNVTDKLVSMEEKMDRVLRYLDACTSPEERELARQVDLRGGPQAVMQDEKLLKEVSEYRTGPSGSDRKARTKGVVDEFKALQTDLQTDVQTSIHQNMEQFQAKFLVQQRELEEQMRRAMHREGDRIIDAVNAGPHDKIIDPDIHEMWKEMRWRGSVKDRHFVLALREYFREKLDQLKKTNDSETPSVPSHRLSEEDEWSMEYIHITRVQPIIEAFDDDGSGFITVQEVNAFTTARPKNWSLLHWLAYWAVGFQTSMSDYAAKIDVLLAKMFSLKRYALPTNRNAIEQYLGTVWTRISTLTAAFRRVEVDEALLRKFEDYTESEEDRLLRNLETVKYDIDARDTLELIRGPGRVEKHLFPLLYLLLKRDFEIMRLARTQCLHVDELFDSMSTVMWVMEAVNERHDSLADLFKQQKLDPAQQFKIFAFEMFKYWHDETEIWSMKRLKEAKFLEVPYDDSLEAQGVQPASVINYPLRSVEELLSTHESVMTEADRRAGSIIHRILGHWSGFCAKDDLYPSQAMFSLDLHVCPNNPKQFQCNGIAPNGTDWSLTGDYTIMEGGVVQYNFSVRYVARFATQHFSGRLDDHGSTLSGTWGFDDKPFVFYFKRLPSELMRFYPSPAELASNKARALWHFATSAIHAQVQRDMGSWNWLQERWQRGKRYVELTVRREFYQLTSEETADLARCHRIMTPEEAGLYQIFRDLRERAIPMHTLIHCAACGDNIRGSRVTCLCCGMKTTIDLCDKESCLASEIGLDARDDLTSPHLPSHEMFKMRRAIHPFREFGEMYRAAQSALKTARQVFAATSAQQAGASVENGSPQCVKCGERASMPCWYCIECEERIFVCYSCDYRHGGIKAGKHQKTHALVRCQMAAAPVDAESEHAAKLNARIETLEENIKEMDYKMQGGFATVDERIAVEQEQLRNRMDERLHALSMVMDDRLQRLSGRMTSLDERLKRIEGLLLVLGQRFSSPGFGDGWLFQAAASSQIHVRQSSWQGTRADSLNYTPEAESEFSAWVRRMRRAG
ncbi:hypothetical protein BD311DRAFT_492317 [Dichomitus squalens]|uniref:EF-hand domain-containing protein n=1 Tax=Dichomitus squalens TaxID=114155 RepID=A0A4Q9MEB5_9APHY|nr:hypothetical protein BD311DRAFT_492317 [Dichomitus squalens]